MRPAVKTVRDERVEGAPALEAAQVIAEPSTIARAETGPVTFDALTGRLLRRYSTPALRVALGVVFLWFGSLKLCGISPVVSLIKQTYSFLPTAPFVFVLSLWEIGVGCGLIFKRAMRLTLLLLLLHLGGTFVTVLQNPSIFYLHSNPLWLTIEGEFLVKNLVLVAAALVVGGYELKRVREPEERFKIHPLPRQ